MTTAILPLLTAATLAAPQPALSASDLAQGFAPSDEALAALDFVQSELEAALPELDPALLDVAPSADWSRDLTLEDVFAAALDVAPAQATTAGSRSMVQTEDRLARLDTRTGYVRYLNGDRAYEHGVSPVVGVGESRALDIVTSAIMELGVPLEEGQTGGIRVDEVLMTGNEIGSTAPPETFVRETMVTIERQVEGVPVVGSHIRASVSNRAELSRLRVQWPAFRISPAVTAMRDRDEVIREAVGRIVSQETRPAEIRPRTVYLPTPAGFVPALEVGVLTEPGSTPFLVHVPLAR